MNDALAIIPIAAGAYVATNLDNLTLLVTLLARFKIRSWVVCCGYIASTFALGLIGFWIGTAAENAPVEYLGLLGLLPMTIGVIGVVKIFRGHDEVNTLKEVEVEVDGALGVFITAFITQISNGTDTVVTFAALFADSTSSADVLIAVSLAAMAAVFVAVALYGVRHPALSGWIERNAHRVTPWILILVGAYIVVNTATDLLPG